MRELWFRRILTVFCVVAGLGVVAHLGVFLWGQNEFTLPESVVAGQSMMLAHDGTLYYNLRDYPFTVNAYMPLFYLLDAGLIRLSIPAFVAGRFISFAALLGIYMVCWRMIMLYTGHRYCAWLGTLLCVSTSLLLSWGTVGQVDTLAVCFALTAFYHYSRHRLGHAGALTPAAVFVVLAVLTKQTMLAAPTAIFLCLLTERPLLANWKSALAFGGSIAAIVLSVVFGWNAATHGNFLANTVFANLNPFAIEQLSPHLNYMLIAAGQLALVAAACARATWSGHGKTLFVYLGFAAAVFLATAPKIGSDSNYQIETTILLVLCAAIGLDAIGFFELLFSGRRTWITLLQLPLAIHMVLNFRITVPFLVGRIVKEQMFRTQVEALKPFVPAAGRVLSTDLNAMVRLRGRVDVEPVIYALLVQAGRIDPTPVQRDLAAGAIPTVILYWDLSKPFESDPKNPGLPESQLMEVQRRYRMVRHIPGPYLDGVYVYQLADKVTAEVRPL
jgi:hypothetical protein